MRKIHKFMADRKKIAHRYDNLLSGLNAFKPIEYDSRAMSANHLYPVAVDFNKISCSKNELIRRLRANGIMTQVHYLPIPLHPYYQKLGYNMHLLPNAFNFYFQILSLPIYPKLSYRSQKRIVNALIDFS